MAAMSSDLQAEGRGRRRPRSRSRQIACGAMAELETIRRQRPTITRSSASRRTRRETGTTKAIFRLGELLENNRALRVYLDSCVKCGAAPTSATTFMGTGDPKNMPVARQDLLRKGSIAAISPGRARSCRGWSARRT